MVKVASVFLFVVGIICAGLAEESPPSVNSPRDAAQASGESAAPSDAPLVSAFHQKDEPSKKDERIRAQAYLSVDKIPAGSTCQVIVVVNVEKGWHINANPPSPAFVIPVKLNYKSKNNVELIDVKYPPGKPFDLDGAAVPILVYDGEVQLRGTVQIPAEAGGLTEDMEINVTYQACHERGCLPPKTIKLIGKLPIAQHGDLIKPVNGKLFNRRTP